MLLSKVEKAVLSSLRLLALSRWKSVKSFSQPNEVEVPVQALNKRADIRLEHIMVLSRSRKSKHVKWTLKHIVAVSIILSSVLVWLPYTTAVFCTTCKQQEVSHSPAKVNSRSIVNAPLRPSQKRKVEVKEENTRGNTVREQNKFELSHLLNVPSFADEKWGDDGKDLLQLPNSSRVASSAILSLYRSLPKKCAREPYIPFLREAVRKYGNSRGRGLDQVEKMVEQNGTLLIHVSADPGANGTSLSNEFLENAGYRATTFSRVVILATAETGAGAVSAQTLIAPLLKQLQEQKVHVILRYSQGQDEDLYLMHISTHLLVHRGSFSAMGALVCEGTVYYTSDLSNYFSRNQFKWIIKNGTPAENTKLRLHQRHLAAMGPVVPSCCLFKTFGFGDGEKVVCANSRAFTRQDCWVLSVGCAGKWSFERSIVANTSCRVHTFDCTGNWKVPGDIATRATLHKICLGQENDSRENFIGLNSMIRRGSSLSGFGESRMPALAKMDIEGHEFPVLRSLIENGQDHMLPDQIAFEVHTMSRHDVGPPFQRIGNISRSSPDIIRQLFQNLSSRGYQLVHRADNPYCSHCSEVTVVQHAALPPVKRR